MDSDEDDVDNDVVAKPAAVEEKEEEDGVGEVGSEDEELEIDEQLKNLQAEEAKEAKK